MSLVAETTEGAFLSAELASNKPGEEPTVPEDLGRQTAALLLEEVYRVRLQYICDLYPRNSSLYGAQSEV